MAWRGNYRNTPRFENRKRCLLMAGRNNSHALLFINDHDDDQLKAIEDANIDDPAIDVPFA